MTMIRNLRPNPYVGPRAFQRGEVLYGRQRELRELVQLLVSERIILCHSPSGAGKTSLINAALIHELEEHRDFFVYPPIRLNLDLPVDSQLRLSINRYVLSALRCLEAGLSEDHQLSLDDLSKLTLIEYLAMRAQSDGDDRVLIIDQLEEIITADPIDFVAKHEFFDQLGAALKADQQLWTLCAIREEYVISIEPYIESIPRRLRARYRLPFLDRQAAFDAMCAPAEQAGVTFTQLAAEQLASDLSRVIVRQPDSSLVFQEGPFIEPVQLQVVCHRLWAHLPNGKQMIDEEDLEVLGDVNSALGNYFSDAVHVISADIGVDESIIRDWVAERLISAQGVRLQVLREPTSSGGLSNEVITALVNAHLVREEQQRGAMWFELAHDRLIEPIRNANDAWHKARRNRLELTTALSAALPADQRGGVQDLAELLAAIAQGNLAPEQVATQIAANTDLSRLVRSLAGTQVPIDGTLISFDSGNQLGNVTIGDVVGSNQITLSINLGAASLRLSRSPMIVGVLTLFVVLFVVATTTIRSFGNSQFPQTNRAIVVDTFINLSSLDTQLGLIDTTMSMWATPEAATSHRELIGKAQIANLQQGIAMHPLHPDMGATFVQNLIASGADPTSVQRFYESLQTAQTYTENLIQTVNNLAEQKPDQPAWISLYTRQADLDHRWVRYNATVANLNGQLLLRNLGYSEADATAKLSLLLKLEPRTFLSVDAIVVRLRDLSSVRNGLIDEGKTLVNEAQKLVAGDLVINANDTWDQVVGKAIVLRNRGEINAAVAAFAQYGTMFSATDPTAAQYSTTAQTFTQQSVTLGVKAGQYIFNVYPDGRGKAAGLQVGDMLITLNQTVVADSAGYEAALNALPANQPFTATFLRLGADDSFQRMTITINQLPIGIDTMPI